MFFMTSPLLSYASTLDYGTNKLNLELSNSVFKAESKFDKDTFGGEGGGSGGGHGGS